jgi:hypothetical protein
LKFYVPQLNDQEVNKILNTTVDNQQSNLKDKIVDYYTKKYNEFEQDKSKGKALLIQKYGKNVVDVDGNVIIKEFLPGILEFYNNFKFSNPQDNFVPLSELKKHQQELVTYYYRNSQKASDAEKRVYAFGQFLELCKDNKVSREELIKFIKQVNVNPAQNLSLATLFYKVVLNVLDKKFAINEIKNLKSTFDALGEDGKRNYENLVQSLSIDKYKVNRGDRMMFKGNEPNLPELDLISGKKYLIIDTKNLYKEDQFEEETNDTLLYENLIAINYYVLVTEENEIENGGQNIWVPASRFDVRKEQVLDYTLNENFKLFESKFIKLKNIVSESENSNPRYSAIVLDQPSKDKLLKIIDNLKKEGTIGENWIISADHITINMGKIYDSELLGRIVNIKVIGIGYNDKVVALRVSTDTDIDYSRKVKRTPHITLAFNREEGGKPSMSNSIENWNNFNNISLKGIIQEIY